MRRVVIAQAGLLGVILVVGPLGCNQQMGVEKRAEALAAAASASAAAAKASAAVPDPKEQKYAAALKTVRERQMAQLSALSKVYEGATDDDRKAFRDFFAPAKETEKEADDLFKEAQFAGKEGMVVKKYEVQDVKLDPNITAATTDVYVEDVQRGKRRCTIYKVDWKDFDGKWRRTARRDFRVIPCESNS
ncbi:MAG: hypothetical protein HYV09_25550 [Deltaproteobacteria bacterium]|nr:hypothetical protein [Deltaproteobacteria bacterium]